MNRDDFNGRGSGTIEVAELMRPPICLGQEGLFTMKQWDFTYSHLLPKKQPILLYEETLTKSCRRCGAIYTTKARMRKRCDACRVIAACERQQRANARLKAWRAAERR
jgi:hypothetical protein